MRKRTFGKRMASWFLSLLFVVTLTNINAVAAQTKPGFSIQFLDVGQADAALVQCDGKYMLIDGGKKSDADEIYAALKEEKVPKLDMVVATHAHEDNVGGLVGAYQYTTADKTLCPQLLLKNGAAALLSRRLVLNIRLEVPMLQS